MCNILVFLDESAPPLWSPPWTTQVAEQKLHQQAGKHIVTAGGTRLHRMASATGEQTSRTGQNWPNAPELKLKSSCILPTWGVFHWYWFGMHCGESRQKESLLLNNLLCLLNGTNGRNDWIPERLSWPGSGDWIVAHTQADKDGGPLAKMAAGRKSSIMQIFKVRKELLIHLRYCNYNWRCKFGLCGYKFVSFRKDTTNAWALIRPAPLDKLVKTKLAFITAD